MVEPASRLTSARLKIEWAQRHIQRLPALLDSLAKSDLHELIIERNADTREYSVKLASKMNGMPADFPLVIGDAVQNLRAALDHATSEIVSVTNERVHFPFCRSRDDLVTHPRYTLIQNAAPRVAETILHEIRPYGTGNGDKRLPDLNSLANRDKHRLLIPNILLTGLTGVDLEDENQNVFTNTTLAVDPGGVLRAIVTNAPIKITKGGQPTLDILFSEGTPFKDEPVIPTLFQLRQLVAQAVAKLELAHFGPAKS